MAAVRRTGSPLLAALMLVGVLTGCSSTITGEGRYVGAGPTSSPTTSAPATSVPTAAVPLAPTTPAISTEELQACTLIPLTDVDAFNQFNVLADGPTPTQDQRNTVATAFDAAATQTQGYVDPLPPGAIRDAAQGYHDAQIAVRDGLTAGTDVTTQLILDQQDLLSTACGF